MKVLALLGFSYLTLCSLPLLAGSEEAEEWSWPGTECLNVSIVPSIDPDRSPGITHDYLLLNQCDKVITAFAIENLNRTTGSFGGGFGQDHFTLLAWPVKNLDTSKNPYSSERIFEPGAILRRPLMGNDSGHAVEEPVVTAIVFSDATAVGSPKVLSGISARRIRRIEEFAGAAAALDQLQEYEDTQAIRSHKGTSGGNNALEIELDNLEAIFRRDGRAAWRKYIQNRSAELKREITILNRHIFFTHSTAH